MTFQLIAPSDPLWSQAADYAERCSWSASKNLAAQMRANDFQGWERVIAAVEQGQIAGYCTLAQTDCIPGLPYTPYIGYLFVGEAFRGNRLSEQLIRFAMGYARQLGFQQVYLISDHVNLYEKYGFVRLEEHPAPWNPAVMETVFVHHI